MEKQCATNPCSNLFAPSLATWRGDERPNTKMRNRTIIAGGQRLSIPLVKQSPDPNDPLISDHGRWRDVHLGAWNAAYGKYPFFIHLYPQLKAVYQTKSHSTLSHFNQALAKLIENWIPVEKMKPEINRMRQENPTRYAEIRQEYETLINAEYSIFDAIFRLGHECIFLFD